MKNHRPADPVPFTGADGHTYVILTRPDGTSERQRLADLVAATFLGPCPAGMELRHGAGGLSDNSVANLSYVPIEAPHGGRLMVTPEPSLELLELALFDLIAMHCEKRGQKFCGDDAETAVALLGPAIKNLVCVVEELQG